MYTIVICSDCQYIWIIDGEPNRSKCPRCETSHQFKNLRHLDSTDDSGEARNLRAAYAAKLNGMKEEFEEAANETNILDEDVDTDIDAGERLRQRGIDPDELDEMVSDGSGGSKSEKEIVMNAVESVNEPSVEDIVEYADARGVGREKVEKVLEKLRKRGEIVGRDPIRLV